MMKRDLMEVGTSLMGGLGLGAIAMYLLDPDKGPTRREMIGRQTGEMLSGATETLQQAGERIRHLRHDARDYAGQAGEKMRHLRDEAADYYGRAGEFLHRGKEEARSHLRGKMMAPESSGTMTAVAAAAGALALGAGIMFLMDPISGRRRRSRIRDKAVRYAHETTDTLSSTGRHLSNRAKGVYYDAKGMMGHHEHDGGHRLGAVEEHGRKV
jgi:hypothetical protein